MMIHLQDLTVGEVSGMIAAAIFVRTYIYGGFLVIW